MHEPKHESEDNVKIQALVQIFKQQSYRHNKFHQKKKNVQFKIAYVSSLYRINQYLEIGNWVDSCKDEFKVKWRILWQRCSLFPQSLYKTAIVKASPSNICRELFQWIGQFCIFPILVKSISKYFLSIDFIDTICSQKLLTN